MGEILLCRERTLGGSSRLLVIKKILPHLAKNERFARRFLDEMRLAVTLTHGNIVQAYEVGEQDGQYYMAMEFVDGPDLGQVLDKTREQGARIPLDVALYILVGTAEALAYAHSRTDETGRPLGIVHRDVSPPNILLSLDGQVKLVDFGVALAGTRLASTLEGALHGKLPYMSPEQVDGHEVDHLSDVFSLGVVAYEMLTGISPFWAETEVGVIDKVRECNPPDIAEVAPQLPEQVSEVVRKALQRDKRKRFTSAAEMRDSLLSCMVDSRLVATSDRLARFLREVGFSPSQGVQGASDVTIPRVPTEVDRQLDLGPKHVAWAVTLVLVLALATYGLGHMFGSSGPAPLVRPMDISADSPLPVVKHPPVQRTPTRPSGQAGPRHDTTKSPSGPEPEPHERASERAEVQETAETVILDSRPRQARVFLRSKFIGRTPVKLHKPGSGKLRLRVELDGYSPATALVSTRSSDRLTVQLDPLPKGRVRFRFFPARAEVLLDGRPIATRANLVDVELSAGEHTLEIRAAGLATRGLIRHLKVQPGQILELGTLELPSQR